MDFTIPHHNKHNMLLDYLNTLFLKWWGVTPLLFLTWVGDKLFLFITPSDFEGWIKPIITLLTGAILLFYTLRKKKRSERYEEEKHRQELSQDKMDAWIAQYGKALEAGIIKKETTLADFIKQLELIEKANKNT